MPTSLPAAIEAALRDLSHALLSATNDSGIRHAATTAVIEYLYFIDERTRMPQKSTKEHCGDTIVSKEVDSPKICTNGVERANIIIGHSGCRHAGCDGKGARVPRGVAPYCGQHGGLYTDEWTFCDDHDCRRWVPLVAATKFCATHNGEDYLDGGAA